MSYLNPHTHKLDEDIERTDTTGAVLYEIARERSRQDAKWGEQNHPDGTDESRWDKEAAVRARALCEFLAARGELTWTAILSEEIAEAYAERDPAKLRAELVQVAAVAVAWVEAIDRRLTTTEENRSDD